MARLLGAVLGGQERGGMAERVARRTFRDRIARFQDLVAGEVRRRIAEDTGVERTARIAVRPPLERLDFAGATRAEMEALRREVYPLARKLASRLVQRQRHGRRGRLDFRRTVRASLASGECRSPPTTGRGARTSPNWSCCATPATRCRRSRTSRCC